jgi:hypothetical protein
MAEGFPIQDVVVKPLKIMYAAINGNGNRIQLMDFVDLDGFRGTRQCKGETASVFGGGGSSASAAGVEMILFRSARYRDLNFSRLERQ